jgi:hypothetical protein
LYILLFLAADPLRQEIQHSVQAPRFKNILAVPAHVLAQSLYHPNAPSDRARAKQLAADLKTARADRVGPGDICDHEITAALLGFCKGRGPSRHEPDTMSHVNAIDAIIRC